MASLTSFTPTILHSIYVRFANAPSPLMNNKTIWIKFNKPKEH